MLRQCHYDVRGSRDLRIDWLRGLAMCCVIIDHSRISSLLAWFSYQRFWTVTAAEVFVVLSGIVLGMVYGRKLAHGDWYGVVRGLTRRALTLYVAFVAVTLSVIVITRAGIDVSSITVWADERADSSGCFFDPPVINAGILARVATMRCGPWPFTIVGLYVWLVAAALPALLALHFFGWRRLIAVSWSLYLLYRVDPRPLTMGTFEGTFPILVWQLLFVHGLAIGYHREQFSAFVARCPRLVRLIAVGATATFAVLAMCNPWTRGPSALHWTLVSPHRFAEIYYRYFTLPDLGIGRLLNLAVALPIGYAGLTWCWGLARPVNAVFVTLGQQSLGAFVLHVYGILMIAQLSLDRNALWMGTVLQIVLVVGIAGLLNVAGHLRSPRPTVAAAQAGPLAA